jgi:hypothetical protein
MRSKLFYVKQVSGETNIAKDAQFHFYMEQELRFVCADQN